MQITLQVSGHLTPYDYESITVSTSAVGLTAGKIEPSSSVAEKDLGKAKLIRISVESAAVRFREDGTDPTATEGHLLNVGDYYFIANLGQSKKFRAIRNSGESVDAKFRVTYFR